MGLCRIGVMQGGSTPPVAGGDNVYKQLTKIDPPVSETVRKIGLETIIFLISANSESACEHESILEMRNDGCLFVFSADRKERRRVNSQMSHIVPSHHRREEKCQIIR